MAELELTQPQLGHNSATSESRIYSALQLVADLVPSHSLKTAPQIMGKGRILRSEVGSKRKEEDNDGVCLGMAEGNL